MSEQQSRPETIHETKARMLATALRETSGNKIAAARLLGVSPGCVRNWIRLYGLQGAYPILPSTRGKKCDS